MTDLRARLVAADVHPEATIFDQVNDLVADLREANLHRRQLEERAKKAEAELSATRAELERYQKSVDYWRNLTGEALRTEAKLGAELAELRAVT